MYLFCNQVRIDHSLSPKVDDVGTNRKRIWYFLLVRHSNQGSILICCNFLVENCKFFLSYSHVARPSSDVLYGTSCLCGEVYHKESHGAILQ